MRMGTRLSNIQDKYITTLSRYFVPCLLEITLIFTAKIFTQTERADFEEKAQGITKLIILHALFLVSDIDKAIGRKQ